MRSRPLLNRFRLSHYARRAADAFQEDLYTLWPGDVTEESFDVPIPTSVVKEKSLRKIAVTLVYNPSFPLDEDQRAYMEQETLTFSVMLSTDFNI
jgi:hypothetical protein